jgi:hypothetical protein
LTAAPVVAAPRADRDTVSGKEKERAELSAPVVDCPPGAAVDTWPEVSCYDPVSSIHLDFCYS